MVLVSSRTICDKVYFLIDGVFVCRFISEENEIKKAVNFYIENVHSFFTCADGYFSDRPTNCELRAIKDSTVIELSRDDINLIIKEDHGVFMFYHHEVCKGLLEENELKNKIITETSENLYKYMVSEYPGLLKFVSTKYIAEFMGITPEWLSKIKRNCKL
jgi:hypothetical protein